MNVAPKVAPVAPGDGSESAAAAEKSASAGFKHDFKHQGRAYQLFKKEQSRDAVWYLRVQHEGQRLKFSLKTNNALAAVARAKEKIDKLKGGQLAAPAPVCSLGQVLRIYCGEAQTVCSVKARTVKGNWVALRLMLRAVGFEVELGKSELFEERHAWAFKISTREINGALVRKFQQAMMARLLEGADARTGEGADLARERVKRTVKSLLTQARSIFNRSMMRHYRERVRLPEEALEGFRTEPTFKLRTLDYQQPDDAIIAATFQGADRWREPGSDGAGPGRLELNQFKAFWLAVGCGLRRGEIGRVRKEHFMRSDGRLFLRSDFTGKDGELIQVPVMSEAAARLLPYLEGDGFVLEGSMTERTEKVFRRISEFMKGLGWKTHKKVHELRAYIGGKVTEQHGLTAAQHFLRHKDHRTTEQKYGRYFKLRNVDVKLGL